MITLYTSPTPNGWKVSIALEELGIPYQIKVVNLLAGEQYDPNYLRINPNGRIPAIVDHDAGDFPVFESGAILIYLAEKAGRLIPADPKRRSVMMQWLMFQMGGIGPMQGQANVFFRYTPEKIQFAIDRYQNETRRLYTVLDGRLSQVEWLAFEYSLADIATYPWVRIHRWAGVETEGLPHLEAWMARMRERPAVARGMKIPPPVAAAEMEQWVRAFQASRPG